MRILNTMAAHAIPFVPRSLIHKISRRYIAGETHRRCAHSHPGTP